MAGLCGDLITKVLKKYSVNGIITDSLYKNSNDRFNILESIHTYFLVNQPFLNHKPKHSSELWVVFSDIMK